MHVPEGVRQDVPRQTVRESPRQVGVFREAEADETEQVRTALRGLPLRWNGEPWHYPIILDARYISLRLRPVAKYQNVQISR